MAAGNEKEAMTLEKVLFTVGSYSGNMADGHTMGLGPFPVGWGRRADGRTMGT